MGDTVTRGTEKIGKRSIINTVGGLREVIADLPDSMPLVEHIDGSGRITYALSFIDPDNLGDTSRALLVLGAVPPPFLEHHRAASANPAAVDLLDYTPR